MRHREKRKGKKEIRASGLFLASVNSDLPIGKKKREEKRERDEFRRKDIGRRFIRGDSAACIAPRFSRTDVGRHNFATTGTTFSHLAMQDSEDGATTSSLTVNFSPDKSVVTRFHAVPGISDDAS
jgi:hypothetical protein